MSSSSPDVPQQPAGGLLIAGPWPSYAGFLHLPKEGRWMIYASAKTHRTALERQGFVMGESYDAFIRRVCNELEI